MIAFSLPLVIPIFSLLIQFTISCVLGRWRSGQRKGRISPQSSFETSLDAAGMSACATTL